MPARSDPPPVAAPAHTRGLLGGDGADGCFELRRHPPGDALLGELVEWFWSVSWSLPEGVAVEKELLNHPSVQLVVERGASGVFPIVRGKATKRLHGRGRAFGAKFHPGAFRAVWRRPLHALGSERLPLERAFGDAGARYERELLACDDDAARLRCARAFLHALEPRLDEPGRLARRLVERIVGDPELGSVDRLAREHGLSTRSLQRLFREEVGVTPKWCLMRARLHDAVEALEGDATVDLAALAARLGYFDQAHFTREFTRVIGRSPTRYLRSLGRG